MDAVNLEEELLRVNKGKGEKDRVVPLSGIACQYLETYLKAIRPELMKGQRDRTNFLSPSGMECPSATTASNSCSKNMTRQLRLKKHVTCHLWRHSCATHLLEK